MCLFLLNIYSKPSFKHYTYLNIILQTLHTGHLLTESIVLFRRLNVYIEKKEYKSDLDDSKITSTTMKREIISFFICGPLDELRFDHG